MRFPGVSPHPAELQAATASPAMDFLVPATPGVSFEAVLGLRWVDGFRSFPDYGESADPEHSVTLSGSRPVARSTSEIVIERFRLNTPEWPEGTHAGATLFLDQIGGNTRVQVSLLDVPANCLAAMATFWIHTFPAILRHELALDFSSGSDSNPGIVEQDPIRAV